VSSVGGAAGPSAREAAETCAGREEREEDAPCFPGATELVGPL
jgi:hypothetical protein